MSEKTVDKYVRPNFIERLRVNRLMRWVISKWVIVSGRARLLKSIVRLLTRRLALSDHSLPGALNFTTGEAVAVKQIQLSNIPKSDLGDIMVRPRVLVLTRLTTLQTEIDLLKKLNVRLITIFGRHLLTMGPAY